LKSAFSAWFALFTCGLPEDKLVENETKHYISWQFTRKLELITRPCYHWNTQ